MESKQPNALSARPAKPREAGDEDSQPSLEEQEAGSDVAASGLARFTKVEETVRTAGNDAEQPGSGTAQSNTPSLGDQGAGASVSVPESAAPQGGQGIPLDSTSLLEAVAVDAPVQASALAFSEAVSAEAEIATKLATPTGSMAIAAGLQSRADTQSTLGEPVLNELQTSLEVPVLNELPVNQLPEEPTSEATKPALGQPAAAAATATGLVAGAALANTATTKKSAITSPLTSQTRDSVPGLASPNAESPTQAVNAAAQPVVDPEPLNLGTSASPGQSETLQAPAAAEGQTEGFTVAADQPNIVETVEVNQAATARVDASKSPTVLPETAPTHEPFQPELGQKVLDRIRINLRPGMRTATIEMTPVELGRVQIKLQMKDGGLSASFRAETAQTREILERQLPELRALLAAQGIETDRIEVDLDTSGFHQPSAGDAKSQQRSPNHSSQGQAFDLTLAASDGSESANTNNLLRDVSGVDTLA